MLNSFVLHKWSGCVKVAFFFSLPLFVYRILNKMYISLCCLCTRWNYHMQRSHRVERHFRFSLSCSVLFWTSQQEDQLNRCLVARSCLLVDHHKNAEKKKEIYVSLMSIRMCQCLKWEEHQKKTDILCELFPPPQLVQLCMWSISLEVFFFTSLF